MLKRSTGFTLIEVTIALAVMMAIATAAIFAQGQNRQRTEFELAIEELRTQVFKVKNEANSTVHGGDGDNQLIHFHGKLVEFTAGSDEIIVRTLLRQCTSLDPVTRECNGSLTITENTPDRYTVQLPSGVRYNGSSGAVANSRAFAFIKNDAHGQLEHVILPNLPIANLLNLNLYLSANNGTQRYNFSYPDSPNISGSLIIETGSVRVERQ
jgi:type II secretory pathway pseudopilin PulG